MRGRILCDAARESHCHCPAPKELAFDSESCMKALRCTCSNISLSHGARLEDLAFVQLEMQPAGLSRSRTTCAMLSLLPWSIVDT